MTTSAAMACHECLAQMLPSERFCRRCGAEATESRPSALRMQQYRDDTDDEPVSSAHRRDWLPTLTFGALTVVAAVAIGLAIVSFDRARTWQDRSDAWQSRAKASGARVADLESRLNDTETKLAVTRVALDRANGGQSVLAAQGRQCLDDLSAALNAVADGVSAGAEAAVAQARTSCNRFDASYSSPESAAAR